MTTKEKIKKEIDKMPDDIIEKVYNFIRSLKIKEKHTKRLHTYKLDGRLDNINIREKAYE